ncbi:MAG TPA: adenylate/guanylate cyclase domain-containing protein [Pseudonocardiaceae bacterium]|nr:adenylate/guanylate cyclase domain-containing protein [Pseudonocardiaceae bacterium]
MAANVIGAGVVVVLLVVVIPGAAPSPRAQLVLIVAAAVYVVGALLVGGWIGTRRSLRVLNWAVTGREPTEHERTATMRVPLQLTLGQVVLWGIAMVVFTALAVVVQPALLPAVPITIGFAGVVVCANAYLLSEFALRPVAAKALSDDRPDRPHKGGVRLRILLFWCLGTGVPVAGLLVLGGLALGRGGYTTDQLAVTVIVLGGIVLVFGLLVTVFTSRAVVAPVSSVRDALDRVRRGELSVRIPVYDGTELGQLQAGVNHMVRGLADRERIRDLFGRHVGEDVADTALAGGIEFGGEVREASVLFVDLAGSTTLAATRPPTEVVDLLNRFFAVVVEEITRHRGLVNKFIGDAALAVFGAPLPVPDHATRALAAARAIAERLPVEVPDVVAGIGVATGPVVAGNIGHHSRFEYTVIGDPVNEAARLTELAKQKPGRLVASATVLGAATAAEAAHWATGEDVLLRGRTATTTLATPQEPAPEVARPA